MTFRKFLPLALGGLALIDLTLAVIGFCFPAIWFAIQHGDSHYIDTQNLLEHSSYFWAIYALLQFIGFFSWRKNLLLWLNTFIAIRIIDIFLISFYIYSDPFLLPLSKITLYEVIPANLVLAWFFWKCLEETKKLL
jgi:hypothetical protein